MTPSREALLMECRELLAVMATEYEIGDEASELQHWPAAEVERCWKAVELRDRIDAALAGMFVLASDYDALAADLVKAREDVREACAKVCEEEICNCCWTEDALAAAEQCAAAIRALAIDKTGRKPK